MEMRILVKNPLADQGIDGGLYFRS